jgi:hypothetical protein
MGKTGVILVLLLALSGPAAGRDIFVSNTGGDDRSTGEQAKNVGRDGPVRTIAKALRLAVGGDRIVLAAGGQPYRECVGVSGLRLSGTARQPLVIVGNGAVLDGSAAVPVGQWRHIGDGVYRFRPPQMGCQQLFLDDRPAAQVAAEREAGNPPKLQPRQWCTFQGDILFRVDPGKLPADHKLTYAALTTGITLFQVDNVVISGLTVRRYQLDGVNALNSARAVRLSAVECRDNGRYGIAVGGASQVAVDGCLAAGNGVAGLFTAPYSETHVYTSRLCGGAAPGWVDSGGRVYFGNRRVEGGREDVQPDSTPPAK